MVNYQRWINISYLVVSALLWMVFRHIAEVVWDLAHWQVSSDVLIAPTDWVAVGLAAILFVTMVRNRRLNEFMGEVALELSKVTWPPRKESVMSAGVIVVLVAIVSLLLVGFDTLWQKVIGLIVFKL
jgi:preprotein translocase subunit SecE